MRCRLLLCFFRNGIDYLPNAEMKIYIASNTTINSVDDMGSNLRIEFLFLQLHRLVESVCYSVGRHHSTQVDEGSKC